MDFLDTVRSRHSVRAFLPRPVAPRLRRAILDSGRPYRSGPLRRSGSASRPPGAGTSRSVKIAELALEVIASPQKSNRRTWWGPGWRGSQPRMAFSPGSRARLTARAMERFPGESLFARLARAVCAAECLPRKELYEAWEVARRIRRHLRGRRVVDLAAGHGLLAYTLLLLDDSSPTAVCVDLRRPPSAGRLAVEIERRWPRLQGRVSYSEAPLDTVALRPEDLVVSVHACGVLTDRILERAVAAGAPVGVLPCCQEPAASGTLGLEGWLDGPLAVDVARALRPARAGYTLRTQRIPEPITPKNRLLIAVPPPGLPASPPASR